MADILDAAQTTTPVSPAGGPPPPVEPPPVPPTPPVTSEPPVAPEPPVTIPDSLIIPPPEPPAPEPTITSTPPPPPTPKKKSRLGVLLAGLLLLVITLPILTIFVKQQIEIRSRAAGTTCAYYDCSQHTETTNGITKIVSGCYGDKCSTAFCGNKTPVGCGTTTVTTCDSVGTTKLCGSINCCARSHSVTGSYGYCQCTPDTSSTCAGVNEWMGYGKPCCTDTIQSTECSGSGTYLSCKCISPPTTTPATKSCVTRTCNTSTKSCESKTTTISSSASCPSSGCLTDSDCGKITTTTCKSLGGSCVDAHYCYLSNKTVTSDCTGADSCCYGTPLSPSGGGTGSNATCIFDHNAAPICVGSQLCDNPIGEMGWTEVNCTGRTPGTPCPDHPDAGYYCTAAGTCIKNGNCLSTTNCRPDASCAGTTPPPQCINIIAYKNGNALSQTDLNALHPGDVITLAFAPGGAATKVRFIINAGTPNETSNKNANGQFIWDYTLENATSFTIETQWFDGSAWH